MHHYVNAITDTKGNALIGYFVRCVDATTGVAAPLYADTSLTPIISVSGVANAAQVDSDGNADFYIALGTYHLDIYATDSTSFVRRISNWAMTEDLKLDAVTTRTAMAAQLSPAAGANVYLSEAGREGMFVWSNSNHSAHVTADPLQALFVAPATDTTGASGAWVRKFNGSPHINWWGAQGDYNGSTGTDNASVFTAAMATLQAITQARPDIGSVWNLGNSLSFLNGGRYYTSAPFDIKSSLLYIDFTGSELIFPANTFGIVINNDTTDIEASRTSGPFPLYPTLVNPCIRSANGTDRTKHGIWMRITAHIIKPEVAGFSGDGIRIGNSNGHTTGNQDGWRLYSPVVSKCGGDGIHAEGADASAGFCDNYHVSLCGRFAIVDLSAAGNKWNGQAADCGVVQAGINSVPAFVYHAGTGKNWAIVVGQEANTTVTPSTSRPDVWIDLGAGSGTDPAIPNWTSGITMLAGGSLKTVGGTGPVQFDHCYNETGAYSVWQLSDGTVVRDPIGSQLGIGGTVEYPSSHGIQNTTGYVVTTTDSTGTSSVQLGGKGIGGINFYGQLIDTAGHNWIWRSDGGYLRLQDNQVNQPIIATPLPGSGLNFGRSTDQPGTAFFYQLAIGYPNTGRIVDMNTAAPVSGYHAQGEIVFNNAPTSGGFVGWVCTAAGTPGTWKTFGLIS